MYISQFCEYFAAMCSTPTAPINGSVFAISPECHGGICAINTFTYFTCNSQYYLVGYGTVVCVGRGTWNLPFPTCEGKSMYKYE